MPVEEILNEIERFCDDHNEAGCRYCPLGLCCETCHGEFENDERAMNAAYKIIQMLRVHNYLYKE